MNTFGNIIGVIEYLDNYSKFLAAQVSSEWRRVVKCNTNGQVFTSTGRFATATVDDVIIHDEYNEVFAQDPLDMDVGLIHVKNTIGVMNGWADLDSVIIGKSLSTYLRSNREILVYENDYHDALKTIELLLATGRIPIQKKYYGTMTSVYYCTHYKRICKYKKVKSIVLFFDRVTKIDYLRPYK